jgi:hypothetical protein
MFGWLRRVFARRDAASDFLSCDIADPRQDEVIVTLDGLVVPFAVAANVDGGWVDVWRTDRMGRPINALGWPIRDRHYGRVAIRWRDDAVRRDWEGRGRPCECGEVGE